MRRAVCMALGLVAVSSAVSMAGPYAPAAGLAGSTAIFKTDPAIVGWATDYQNYSFGPNVV